MSAENFFGPMVTEEDLAPLEDGQALVLLHRGPRPEAELVAVMVEQLEREPTVDAVATAEAVTDAVKVVDHQGQVIDTLDRAELVYLGLPAVVRRTAWQARRIDRVRLL